MGCDWRFGRPSHNSLRDLLTNNIAMSKVKWDSFGVKKIPHIITMLIVFLFLVQISYAAQGSVGGSQGGSSTQNSAGQGSSRTSSPQGAQNVDQTLGDQDRDRLQDRDQIRDPSTHDGDEPLQDRDQNRDQDRDRININLESVAVPASTTLQLNQMVQNREREMNREMASTTSNQNVIRNMNQVRLAVYTLLSSENLLQGIGPEVSNIAKQINSTNEIIANAEENIQSRGLLGRLFFGGDKANSSIIEAQVNQNKIQLQKLEELMAQAQVSLEVKATIREQIQVITEEQTRLLNLINGEYKRWGIFSWRF